MMSKKLTIKVSTANDLVTGTFTSQSGNPISGAKVSLFVDSVLQGTSLTNAKGQYSFSYAFKPGTYTLWTTSGMTTSPKITITVTSVLAAISLSASATSVNTGQSVDFNGKATDGAGNPMPGLTLYVFEGTAQQQEVATAADGTFSFSLTFDVAGSFTVDVSSTTSNT